jgi:hypothetical protein
VEILYNQVQTGTNVELVVDRRTIVGQIDRSSGSGSISIGAVDLTPKDHISLSLTPPRPFAKGAALGLDVDRVTLTPVQ